MGGQCRRMLARSFFAMTTNLELAQAALSLLGEIPILFLADNAKAARVCNQNYEAAISEVLQMGRWSAATKPATLAIVLPAPISGFTNYFQLPSDLVRVLDVNGEDFSNAQEFFKIEGRKLASNEPTCVIRYVGRTLSPLGGGLFEDVTISTLGPLLQNAIACRLAMKIAVSITGSEEKQVAMEVLFKKALAEARIADAQECGSRENSGWSRIFGRSRLLASRGGVRNPERLEG